MACVKLPIIQIHNHIEFEIENSQDLTVNFGYKNVWT